MAIKIMIFPLIKIKIKNILEANTSKYIMIAHYENIILKT